MFADVVEQAAERHQLRHEHHLGCEADGQHVDAARVKNRRHDASLVEQTAAGHAVLQHLDRYWDLHVVALRIPVTLCHHK